MPVYRSMTRSLSGFEQQISTMPASISRWRMPPWCCMATSPETNLLLQVPHSPRAQEDGSRIVTGLRQEPDVAWGHGAIYTVMNNRDQIDVLYPEHFSADDNNDGPAEVMYRADQGADFGWPYCYFDYRHQKLLLSPEYGGDGREAGR